MNEPQKKSFQKYAKILTFLRKRKRSQRPTYTRGGWPTQTSFTLLNSIDALTQPQPQTAPSKPIRNHSACTLKSTTISTSTPIFHLQRPATPFSPGPHKKHSTVEPNHRKAPQRNLFECLKEQKLARLRSEKETLMTTIFNEDKIEIHRIDEDQQICNKANSINFKTYFSLNKLMDLQEKINQTVNLRPKTSCSQLRKRIR